MYFDLRSEVKKKCQLYKKIFSDFQLRQVFKWRGNRRFEVRPFRRRRYHQGSNSGTSPRHDVPAQTLGHGGMAKRSGGRNEVLFRVVLLAREHFIEFSCRERLQLYIAHTTRSKL